MSFPLRHIYGKIRDCNNLRNDSLKIYFIVSLNHILVFMLLCY